MTPRNEGTLILPSTTLRLINTAPVERELRALLRGFLSRPRASPAEARVDLAALQRVAANFALCADLKRDEFLRFAAGAFDDAEEGR